mmetsp:Transcript_25853/g.86026  ORF Transcript_25853/g.86026 Transcript_25853/m.86026 type:complete len:199 (-) Transcript_25853:286-882(-)
MARAGLAEYHHSIHGPNQKDGLWREVINRQHWDHPFHPLREQVPKPSFAQNIPSSLDAQSQPWALLNRSFQVGKDDGSTAFLDGRLVPRGLPQGRTAGPGEAAQFSGHDPRSRNAHTLGRGLRASRSSGELQMSQKFAATRGDFAGAGREGRGGSATPSVRSRVSSAAGWSGAQHDFVPHVGGPERHRMPSFSRIHNT